MRSILHFFQKTRTTKEMLKRTKTLDHNITQDQLHEGARRQWERMVDNQKSSKEFSRRLDMLKGKEDQTQ